MVIAAAFAGITYALCCVLGNMGPGFRDECVCCIEPRLYGCEGIRLLSIEQVAYALILFSGEIAPRSLKS